VGVWGQQHEKQKQFCTTLQNRPKQNTHRCGTKASVIALLVQGSCVTYHQVPSDERWVTVHLWVQVEPKMSSKLKKYYKMSNDSQDIYPRPPRFNVLHHSAIHCNTLQNTAKHCKTLQNTATHTAAHYSTLQHTATHCNTLQHTAKHCNTLQQTATHGNTL